MNSLRDIFISNSFILSSCKLVINFISIKNLFQVPSLINLFLNLLLALNSLSKSTRILKDRPSCSSSFHFYLRIRLLFDEVFHRISEVLFFLSSTCVDLLFIIIVLISLVKSHIARLWFLKCLRLDGDVLKLALVFTSILLDLYVLMKSALPTLAHLAFLNEFEIFLIEFKLFLNSELLFFLLTFFSPSNLFCFCKFSCYFSI